MTFMLYENWCISLFDCCMNRRVRLNTLIALKATITTKKKTKNMKEKSDRGKKKNVNAMSIKRAMSSHCVSHCFDIVWHVSKFMHQFKMLPNNITLNCQVPFSSSYDRFIFYFFVVQQQLHRPFHSALPHRFHTEMFYKREREWMSATQSICFPYSRGV